MSDAFDLTLKAAADAFFLLPGTETITYIPGTGQSRQIEAVVTRLEAEQMPSLDGGARPLFEVLVKNDSSSGISSDEIDTGADKIEIGVRVKNKPRNLRACEVLNHDAGLMYLALR